MTEHEHDEHIEDLDVADEESEDVKGGQAAAISQIKGEFKFNVGDGSVLKLNPGQFQVKL